MNVEDSLKAARDAGVDVALDGEDLVLEASAPPTAAVLEALSRNKSEIIVFLRFRSDGETSEDGNSGDERAGIDSLHVTEETETRGIPWAEWQASMLNCLFHEQGLTGQPGQITAETVRHGEPGTIKEMVWPLFRGWPRSDK